MTYPRALARLSRRTVNPVVTRLAGRKPPLALLEHRGRRSGRLHRTPVMAFADGDGYTIALTFGDRSDWVRNLLAAGEGRLMRGARWHQVTAPEILPVPPATMRPPAWARAVIAIVRPGGYVHIRAS